MPEFTVAFSLRGSVTVDAKDADEAVENAGKIDLKSHVTETVCDYVVPA